MSNIRVEIVFAMPDRQWLRQLTVSTDDAAADIVSGCGLREAFPEFDFSSCVLGVWGHEIDAAAHVRDGDRIEVYRPLQVDPREARRIRLKS